MSRVVLTLTVVGTLLLAVGGWMITSDGQDEPSSAPSSTTSTSTSATSSTASPEEPATSSVTTSSSNRSTSPTATKSSSSSSSTSSSTTAKDPEEEAGVPPVAQRRAMVTTARGFLQDLSATDRSPKQWWEQVESHLTTQAATDMKGMEPSWMPPMKVTSGGWVVAQDEDAVADPHAHAGELTVEVVVPTDAGKVTVTLSPDGSGDYKVMKYALPEGVR